MKTNKLFFITVVTLFLSLSGNAQTNSDLLPVYTNAYLLDNTHTFTGWGWMDKNGKIVVPPVYIGMRSSSHGYFLANPPIGRTGTIRLGAGQEAPFYNIIGKNGSVKTIKASTMYSDVWPLKCGNFLESERLSISSEIVTLRDSDGNIIKQTNACDPGIEDNAWLNYLVETESNKYAFQVMNLKNGEIQNIPADFVWEISEDVAQVYVNDGEDRRYGYYDLIKQEWIVKPQYLLCGEFSHGLAWVADKGYFFFINKQGKKVLGPYSGGRHSFSDNLAYVWMDNNPVMIDINGNVVFNCRKSRLYNGVEVKTCYTVRPEADEFMFKNGVAIVSLREEKSGSLVGYTFIDKKGRFITDSTFKKAHIMIGNPVGKGENNKWYVLSSSGDVIAVSDMEPEYYSNNYIKIKQNGAYKVIDDKGKIYNCDKTAEIKFGKWENGKAIMEYDGKYYVVTSEGVFTGPYNNVKECIK